MRNNKKYLFLLASISAFAVITTGGYGTEKVDEPIISLSPRHQSLNPKQLELIEAVKSGDLPTVKRLINKDKVNKDTQNIEDDGDSLVHIAIKEQRQDVFSFLLKVNCDADIKNYYGDTPLHVAASNNYKKMLDELLEEESANVNTQDDDGNTAFHEAIQKRNLECALSFMEAPEKSFDYTLKNKKGMTVLDILNKQTQGNSEYAAKVSEIKDKITRFANIPVSTILQTEAPITPVVQNMASLMIQRDKKIFFSYCWNNEYGTKPMVDDFEAFIKKLGITNYYRDVRDEDGKGMTSGTHIEDFMKNAKDSDVVVIFLNNAYLKSRNCMYEFLQVWDENSKKVSPKVFVIRHPEFVSVFGGPSASLAYTDHWNTVFKNLRSKEVSASDMQWHSKEEGFVAKITSNINPILQELTGHIQAEYRQLRSKGFEDIFKVALGGESYNEQNVENTLNVRNLKIQSLPTLTENKPVLKAEVSSSEPSISTISTVKVESVSLKAAPASRTSSKAAPASRTSSKATAVKSISSKEMPVQSISPVLSSQTSQIDAPDYANYQKGLSFEENNDYKNAFDAYWDAAENGNVDAMSRLGELYRTGQGVKQDSNEALKWHEKAANENVESMFRVGMAHFNGIFQDGLKKTSYTKALEFYTKAAEKGHIEAMESIANIYEKGGLGVKKDQGKVTEWRQKARKARELQQ